MLGNHQVVVVLPNCSIVLHTLTRTLSERRAHTVLTDTWRVSAVDELIAGPGPEVTGASPPPLFATDNSFYDLIHKLTRTKNICNLTVIAKFKLFLVFVLHIFNKSPATEMQFYISYHKDSI